MQEHAVPGQERTDTCGCPDNGKYYPCKVADACTTGLISFKGQYVNVNRTVKQSRRTARGAGGLHGSPVSWSRSASQS